jgi:hypothetical protein
MGSLELFADTRVIPYAFQRQAEPMLGVVPQFNRH